MELSLISKLFRQKIVPKTVLTEISNIIKIFKEVLCIIEDIWIRNLQPNWMLDLPPGGLCTLTLVCTSPLRL